MRGLTKYDVGTSQAVLWVGYFRERLTLKIQSQFVCQWVAMIGINGEKNLSKERCMSCLLLKKRPLMI